MKEILFRKHRGSLSESMTTVKEVKSLDDIYNYCELDKFGISNNLKIEYYGEDSRINWSTYIVTHKNYGVLGFTNKLLE
jgi:hypothetical protein